MDGWVGGSLSQVKDCLLQSKMKTNKKQFLVQIEVLWAKRDQKNGRSIFGTYKTT